MPSTLDKIESTVDGYYLLEEPECSRLQSMSVGRQQDVVERTDLTAVLEQLALVGLAEL